MSRYGSAFAFRSHKCMNACNRRAISRPVHAREGTRPAAGRPGRAPSGHNLPGPTRRALQVLGRWPAASLFSTSKALEAEFASGALLPASSAAIFRQRPAAYSRIARLDSATHSAASRSHSSARVTYSAAIDMENPFSPVDEREGYACVDLAVVELLQDALQRRRRVSEVGMGRAYHGSALVRGHQAPAGIAASCWHQGVAGHLSIHTSTNVVCRFFVVGGIWHVGCMTVLTTTAYELRSELPGWQVSATDDGDKEIEIHS